ncbi:MAG: alpha/beta hydrolase [Gammaproteobacteria bacterium]
MPWPIILMVFIVAVLEPAGAETHIPTTVSKEARDFLKNAAPADLSKPVSTQQWQQLRDELASEYDSTDRVREQYVFSMEEKEYGGVKTVVFTSGKPDNEHQDKILLHIHGGAYVVGSPRIESAIAVPVAYFTGLKVVSVKYRLAPEHPFPAGLDDVFSVYKALLKEYSPGKIAIMASSAGGGLALAMLLKAGDNGLPMPAALGLFSPWTDITKTGDSYYTLEGISPVLQYEKTLRKAAEIYAGNYDMHHPLISPVYADYRPDFPQTFIQVGTRDLLLSDSARLQHKLISVNVNVKLRLWEGMWHAFQMNPLLPEGKKALREMANYLSSTLDTDGCSP